MGRGPKTVTLGRWGVPSSRVSLFWVVCVCCQRQRNKTPKPTLGIACLEIHPISWVFGNGVKRGKSDSNPFSRGSVKGGSHAWGRQGWSPR